MFLFSRLVVSHSFWPHGLQHARLHCLLLYPKVCSNSCSICRWCPWTISLSVAPFSSCLQSFQALESFPMTWLFASGGQSIGASPLASFLLVNIQSWFPIGVTGLSPHSPRDSQKSSQAPQFKKASILQHPAYFMVRCSHLYMTTGKNIALTIWISLYIVG